MPVLLLFLKRFCENEEVTTLLVPGMNNGVEEIRRLASADWEIPLHLSRFFPRYRMSEGPPMPVERVYRLEDEARAYLSFACKGNC